MNAMKKATNSNSSTPIIRIEYDYGSGGERRTQGFKDANKAKKFLEAKEKAGANPKQLQEDGKAEETPKPTHATDTKPEKPTEEATTKKPRIPGVRPMRTRPYLAGTIIAKHGLVAGVTAEMVAELDKAYGKSNPTESQFCLKNAFHAVRGYLGIAEDAVE